MLRRVADIDTLGALELFSADECDRVADTVLDLRDAWRTRSPNSAFFTLGVNAYMDLEQAVDPQASYHLCAVQTNTVLRERFGSVLTTLSAGLEEALGMSVRYVDDLALPGFHVWTSSGIPRTASSSIHFDLQYQRLLTRPEYAHATGTMSFTLPIRLPAGGSSLLVWPGFAFPDDVPRLDVARTVGPRAIEYHVGTALVHSGHVLHQIGPTPTVAPDDIRITLQGHGLVETTNSFCTGSPPPFPGGCNV